MTTNPIIQNPMIFKQTLPNGMDCFTIPKKGYAEKQAAIVVKYGGADADRLPGIAHFLEHKLFEDPQLSMFDAFTQQGASVNAYTHFTHTVYHFSTVQSFPEHLQTLFRLINTPHFTEENVEKEKGIILAEIDMYADNPFWQVYTGLHRALFSVSPLRQEILGTRESVQTIQPDQLYECYHQFYTPDNMALICIGDFEPTQVTKWSKTFAHPNGRKMRPFDPRSILADEPAQAAAPFIAQQMPVSIPLFQLGFKALYEAVCSPITMAASHILIDMIAGESAKLYADLYDLGMIDNQFSVEYIGGTSYGIFMIAGASPQPEAVRERILQAIAKAKAHGLDSRRFEIIKGKHIGRYVRGFNSIETLSSIQADMFTRGQDIAQALEAFCSVTLEDAEVQLHAVLNEAHCALSVIRP
ncbi:MAG: insulinase family protein [Defluviitaleaceae bacterium]|nr:insulinase family protein [Defluviitaleaceae bacterium]